MSCNTTLAIARPRRAGAHLTALTCGLLGAAAAQQPTIYDQDHVLELRDHPGAIDCRPIDYTGDGFLDLVTFFAPGQQPHLGGGPPGADPGGGWGIKFWKSVPDPLTNRRRFVDDTRNRIAPTTDAQGRALLWDGVEGIPPRPVGLPRADVFTDIYDLEFVDVDSNGVPDLIVAGRQPHEDKIFDLAPHPDQVNHPGLWLIGQRRFAATASQQSQYYRTPGIPAQRYPYRWTTGVAIGRIDNDAFPDAVLCYRCTQPKVFVYDPPSNDFVEYQTLPPDPGEYLLRDPLTQQPWRYVGNGWRGVTLGDLNGDGVLDIVGWRTAATSYPALFEWSRNENTVQIHPLISRVHVWEGQADPSDGPSYVFSYTLNPPAGVDRPETSSQSLQCFLADIGPDPRDPTSSLPDLIVPVGNAPTRDYRPRIYRNILGKLGERAPLPAATPLHTPYVSSLYGSSWPELNAHGAWAAVADVNGDSLPDVAIAHHTDNRQPLSRFGVFHPHLGNSDEWAFEFGFLNLQAPPGQRIEDDVVGDRVYLGTGPWTWTQMLVATSPTSGFPLEIRPTDVDFSTTPVANRNDNTRYMRFADLDNDGRPEMIETNFWEVTGPLPAYNPRIFWNQL